jgi:hypothetical protein
MNALLVSLRFATSRTLPPSASTSARSADFSCAVQTRRRSDGPRNGFVLSTSFVLRLCRSE